MAPNLQRDITLMDVFSSNEGLRGRATGYLSRIGAQNPALGRYLESSIRSVALTSDKILDVIRVGINSGVVEAQILCLNSLVILTSFRPHGELRERFGSVVRNQMEKGHISVRATAQAAAAAIQELSESEVLSRAFSDKFDAMTQVATLSLGVGKIGNPMVRASALISLLPSQEDSRDAETACQALALLLSHHRAEIEDALPRLAQKVQGMLALNREDFQLHGIGLLCIAKLKIGEASRIRELCLKSKSERVRVSAAEYLVGYCKVEEAEYRTILSGALVESEYTARYQRMLAQLTDRTNDTVAEALLRVSEASQPAQLGTLFSLLIQSLTTANAAREKLSSSLKQSLQPELFRAIGRASGSNQETGSPLRAKAIEILKLARTL